MTHVFQDNRVTPNIGKAFAAFTIDGVSDTIPCYETSNTIVGSSESATFSVLSGVRFVGKWPEDHTWEPYEDITVTGKVSFFLAV